MQRRFRILRLSSFKVDVPEIYEMFIYKHTETVQYVKK